MDWQNLEPWWRFGAALLIGALVGLEREYRQQRSQEQEFGGIRTFALLGLVGAVAAHLAARLGAVIFIGAYLGIILLLWVSILAPALREGHQEGITTEVAALIVPLLGAMVIWDEAQIAGALGVITALLLALKPRLHRLARRMSAGDLRATLEFSLITAVILPLLPNRGFGPFGVINPFAIWTLVVLVSGISFLGYTLMKFVGAARGIGLIGVLGGLVSSTATTVGFANQSKRQARLSRVLAVGILLSSCVMYVRVAVEIGVVNASLLRYVLPPLAVMLLVGLAWAAALHRRLEEGSEAGPAEVELSNPLRLGAAVGFGVLFTVVIVAVRAASEYLGSAGVFAASALAGITDVDSITLSVAELALGGQLQARVAARAILLAAAVNTVAKGVMASVLGSPSLRRLVGYAFGAMLLAGGVGVAVMVILVP